MQAVVIEKEIGAPERIRTSDPQIRSLVLYPAELRARRPARSVEQRRSAGFNPKAERKASIIADNIMRTGFGLIRAAKSSLVGVETMVRTAL